MTYDAVKVPVVAPRSRVAIEAEARRLLAAIAPECLRSPSPAPMVAIFDMELRKRFDFVAHVAALAPGLEGITDCVEREVILPPHIYEGMENGDGRCRFSAAHETGHVVLHADELASRVGAKLVNGGNVLLARRSTIKPYLDPEWQANAFAAGLLMPEEMVRRLASQTRRYLLAGSIMSAFAVSREAADNRIIKLGL